MRDDESLVRPSRSGMTHQQSAHNQLVTEGWGAYSVIAVSFEDDHNAYNALTLLKELDSQKRVGVQEAVGSWNGPKTAR